MIKKITSVTVFNDAVGKRMSATYSEIDDGGTIISDNKRLDRLVTDSAIIAKADDLAAFAQNIIDEL